MDERRRVLRGMLAMGGAVALGGCSAMGMGGSGAALGTGTAGSGRHGAMTARLVPAVHSTFMAT